MVGENDEDREFGREALRIGARREYLIGKEGVVGKVEMEEDDGRKGGE